MRLAIFKKEIRVPNHTQHGEHKTICFAIDPRGIKILNDGTNTYVNNERVDCTFAEAVKEVHQAMVEDPLK